MIKLEKTEIFGWDAAVRGMRNPMNSHNKSDSGWVIVDGEYDVTRVRYQIGENDLKRMKSLSKAGTDHAKFLRMINVTVDITAPLYWWKEFKTYRNGRKFANDETDLIPDDYLEYDIETNSCSTMHKIHDKEFVLEDFSHEHLNSISLPVLNGIINVLNTYRKDYNLMHEKEDWWQMIQLLPSSYNQKRTVQLNYQVLKNMYHARKNHKLDEWRAFCKWCEVLPYFTEICGKEV